MNQKKQIQQEYQKQDVADSFDEMRQKYVFSRYKHKIESNFLKKTIQNYEKKNSIKILDVACGTGRMLPVISKFDSQVHYYGLDSSLAMTKKLKKKSEKYDFPVNLTFGDATQMPFEDNSFDICYTFHLTWHLPKNLQKKIIKEMLRVTKENGYIVFDILNKDFIWEKIKKIGGKLGTAGLYKLSVSDVVMLLGEKQYKIEKLTDFPIKNRFFYFILNILNQMRRLLPKKLYHLLYFQVRK